MSQSWLSSLYSSFVTWGCRIFSSTDKAVASDSSIRMNGILVCHDLMRYCMEPTDTRLQSVFRWHSSKHVAADDQTNTVTLHREKLCAVLTQHQRLINSEFFIHQIRWWKKETYKGKKTAKNYYVQHTKIGVFCEENTLFTTKQKAFVMTNSSLEWLFQLKRNKKLPRTPSMWSCCYGHMKHCHTLFEQLNVRCLKKQ